jgi:hypothetical protein
MSLSNGIATQLQQHKPSGFDTKREALTTVQRWSTLRKADAACLITHVKDQAPPKSFADENVEFGEFVSAPLPTPPPTLQARESDKLLNIDFYFEVIPHYFPNYSVRSHDPPLISGLGLAPPIESRPSDSSRLARHLRHFLRGVKEQRAERMAKKVLDDFERGVTEEERAEILEIERRWASLGASPMEEILEMRGGEKEDVVGLEGMLEPVGDVWSLLQDVETQKMLKEEQWMWDG